MINKNSIENLKNYVDVVDVVSSYMELKKNGANFKGLCPFHGESTPSFVVSPAKQIFHCFGCGVGGDSIKFVMEYEKLSYPEAIEKLASNYNFSLEYDSNNYQKQDTKAIESLNHYYQTNLRSHQTSLSYLQERAISNASIEKFEIGYAPSSQESINYLKNQKFNLSNAQELGLIDTGHSGLYARFIERITFPIYSLNGGIVGFGGRTITGHQAKYVNSPQTKIFNKSRLLYGYHLSKQSIYKKKRIIVCEGYLDVVMLHQAGFDEAVATLGTALTNEHIPIIKRGEPFVVLSYDGDNAGQKAAYKASVMLSQQKCNGGVVVFGEGLDPADMVKDNKIEELNRLFDTPKGFVEFAIDYIASQYDLNVPENIEKAYDEVVNYLGTLSKIIRAKYEDYAKQKLKLNNVNLSSTNVFVRENQFNRQVNLGKKDDLAELQIIKTVLTSPDYIDFVLEMMDSSMFKTHAHEFDELIANQDFMDSKVLKDIYFKDEIKSLSYEELEAQVKMLLIQAFLFQKAQISQSDMDFKTKAYNIRKCDTSVMSLKKGKLVPFVKLV